MQLDRLKKGYIILFSVLLLLSLYLAWNRVYQVDEAQNVYEAWLMAAGKARHYDMYAPIYLFGLKHVAGFGSSAASMYLLSRLCWVPVFWGILLLIARSASSSWGSAVFWKALLVAAFTAPLWTYGLEVRHDGPALLLMLAAWCLLNPRKAFRPWAHAWVGLFLALIYFCSAKHLLYMVPVVGLGIWPGRPLHRGSALRRLIETGLGLSAGLVFFVLLHVWNGSLGQILHEYRAFYSGVGQVDRFGPWVLFRNLVEQCPLALAIVTLPALAAPGNGVRDAIIACWTNGVAGLVFLASVLLGILANPVPFPYNSLPLIGVGLAVGLGPFLVWWEVQEIGSLGRALIPALTACTLVLPWGIQILHLVDMDNFRQTELMDLAERFSGPEGRVFDAAGLVPGRDSIEPTWFIHLGNARAFQTDPTRSVERLIRSHPPAVVIPTYRMNYLDEEAQGFIQKNYTALAGDFWVLGQAFTERQGKWECLLPGRYWIQADPGASCTIDGTPVQTGPRDIAAGDHTIILGAQGKASIFWLGPALQMPPRVGQGAPGVFPIPIQM